MASIGKRLYIAWHTVREKQAALSRLFGCWRKELLKTCTDRGWRIGSESPVLWARSLTGLASFQARPAVQAQGWAPVRVYYREVDAEAHLSPLQSIAQLGSSASYPVFAHEEPERVYVAWT